MSTKLISGAQALAYILKKESVEYVFAYPGTSELAICDAVLNTEGLTLINGRGDKESAFMAAGGSLLKHTKSVALLHGARGLTNAAGAIADANRNEVGTVFFVGLPSSSSAKFLPPHGEEQLISSIGNFAKCFDEITDIPEKHEASQTLEIKAREYIRKIQIAIQQSRSLPIGPTILGIPQDISEQEWIPMHLLENYKVSAKQISAVNESSLQKAIQLIQAQENIVIFLDDALYRNPIAKEALATFAKSVGAPIFQVFYGRGPMLFEKSTTKQNPLYVGTYQPNNPMHKKIMTEAQLLITLEDRNMYERVVGELPKCPKIAITSNSKMTQKNMYLQDGDILLVGDVVVHMQSLSKELTKVVDHDALLSRCESIRKEGPQKLTVDSKYDFMRNTIVEELARHFENDKKPILIDDSQMFGGLINEGYEYLPAKLRVFGDHGAFIGGGLPLATGLARCERDSSIYNTLGDQSFTNSIQGLVSAVQENAHITYIVCNNGKSVSLFKQILSQNSQAFDTGKNKFLFNAPYNYADLAKSLGLTVFSVIFDPDSADEDKRNPQETFRDVLAKCRTIDGPVLIELKLPSDPEAWEGIWTTKGNEK